MIARLRIAVIVVSAYVLARLISRLLVMGVVALNREVLVQMLIVPATQLIALALVRRVGAGRPASACAEASADRRSLWRRRSAGPEVRLKADATAPDARDVQR